MSDEKQLGPVQQFEKQIASYGKRIKSLLPEHVTENRFMRVTVMAVQRQPDMLRVNRDSLLQAVLDCAEDGLLPNGKEAALVKFGDQAVYMPMIGGIHKKIRQSGELLSIDAQVVYDGDEWDYWIDDEGPHFKWRPSFGGDRGQIKLVFAQAITKDGGKYFEVMSVDDVEKVRAASKAAKNGPWVQWWEEMAKKTVTRRLAKRLPMATDVERVIERDNQFYDFDEPRDVSPKQSASESVKDKLKQRTGKQEEPEPQQEAGQEDDKPVATPPEPEEEKQDDFMF